MDLSDFQSISQEMPQSLREFLEPLTPREGSPELSQLSLSAHPIPAQSQTDVIEPAPTTKLTSLDHDQSSLEPASHNTESNPPSNDAPTTGIEPAIDTPPAVPAKDEHESTGIAAEKALTPISCDFKAVYAPSSPLSSIGTPPRDAFPYKSPSPDPLTSSDDLSSHADSVLENFKENDDDIYEFDYDEADGHRVLRIKPTAAQWDEFPSILAFARARNADEDGCFKMVLPLELQEPLPEKGAQKVPANAYKPKHIKKNNLWRVNTVPSEGVFASDVPGPVSAATVTQAVNDLRKLYGKNNDKLMRNIRYRVDVPAWTADQRLEAGVPEQSPIYPLKGDKLDQTRAVIPGIHTPYVYESGPYFGASFQIHAEDFRLVSLNHLYKGRKIWIVVPSTAVDIAEEALGRKGSCSQFMRHRAEFLFPQKLEKMGIPYRIIDQRPGETIVVLPDAYHEGFSTGYTLAEAKNYGDPNWTTDTYQPCEASCQLVTAIPAELMRPLEEGEIQLDLCAGYEATTEESEKRHLDDNDMESGDLKRIKA